jgi:hypothetical protein
LYAGYPSGRDLCNIILKSAESEEHKKILEASVNSLMDISNEFSQLYSRDKLIEIIKKFFDVNPICEPTIHCKDDCDLEEIYTEIYL